MIAIEKSSHDDIYTKDCCILTCAMLSSIV